MKTKVSAAVLFSVIVNSSSLYARPAYGSPHSAVNSSSSTHVVIPQNFEKDGEVYDLSVSGFRQYLDGLRKTGKDELADKLEPKVTELESKGTTAAMVAGGFAVAALGCAAYALSYKSDLPGKDDVRSENFMKDDEDAVKGKYAVYSIVLAGTGILSYNLLSPSRKDFMELINIHNRAAKTLKEPILKMNLGLAPQPDSYFPSGVLKLSWNF